MKNSTIKNPLVLSFFPNARGFSYALFEGVLDPVDWGMKTLRGMTASAALQKAAVLIDIFEPSVIVVRDCSGKVARCSKRAKRLMERIKKIARKKRILFQVYSRANVRACFARYGARTKDEIARAIAERLPEFDPHVPELRKIWMSENHRMGLFDALALVFTYYWREHLQTQP